MTDIRLLYGPMLIGVFFNMILYGVFLVQTYHYYLTYKRDASWIKILVLYLFCIETINTACDMAIMFQPLIDRFGLPEATLYFPTLFASEPILVVCVSMPIQLFFAWRVYLLTKSKILAAIITTLALISFGGGTWTTVMVVKVKLFARKPELHTPALVWFLAAAMADVLITVVLVLTLSKRKTGFVSTDDAISKIIRMTVQTGMLTALFALGDIVFFMSLPHTALNFVWDLALAKESSGYHASQQRYAPSSSGGAHRPGEKAIDAPAHILNSSVYELDTRKSFVPSDTEYGVKITKIVETRQDAELHHDLETQ